MNQPISAIPLRFALLLTLTCGLAANACGLAQGGQGVETKFSHPQVWEFEPEKQPHAFTGNQHTSGLILSPTPQFGPSENGGGYLLNDSNDVAVIHNLPGKVSKHFPSESIAVSAWVAIEAPHRWGGIVSCVQDNGEAEKGIVLGFDEEKFTFGLASEGADDGDGKITYLRGTSDYVLGRWHHVVGTYDGALMSLYVDGKLESTSTAQSGAILYEFGMQPVIGSYRDANEDHPLDGRLLQVKVDSFVPDQKTVSQVFAKRQPLTQLPSWTDMELEFLVRPYLTWPTLSQMSVLFETTTDSKAKVRYRRDDEPEDSFSIFESTEIKRLHECRLQGLLPDQKYFYQVVASDMNGKIIESPLLSFRTAASPDKAFTFVVIGDTQTNGDVAKRVSDLAWMHRPNLIVHAGDLVDTGTNKSDWTGTFFPSMQPLMGRVPIMPVLGNHEQDAPHYYRYMSLPEPERWYSFRFGNAEFFMMDGNRSLADQSLQLAWLENALKSSTAKWRFAVLHQPPYTSDSDDYGDTTKTKSFQGDPNVRNIVSLLEKHGVDICFSGHVHDYERTFPIRDSQVTAYEEGGVIYVTAAGGGGSLENFDPSNTWFGHKKAQYHHLVYVAIHGEHLEFQAIDQRGRLFDTLKLRKRPERK